MEVSRPTRRGGSQGECGRVAEALSQAGQNSDALITRERSEYDRGVPNGHPVELEGDRRDIAVTPFPVQPGVSGRASHFQMEGVPPLVLVSDWNQQRVGAVVVRAERAGDDEIDEAGLLLHLSEHRGLERLACSHSATRDLDASHGRVAMDEYEQT